MAESIFSKLKAKLKKEPEEVEELEELEELEEEYEEVEEATGSLIDKVKAQLPFLNKFLGGKQEGSEELEELDELESDSTGEHDLSELTSEMEPEESVTRTSMSDGDSTGDIDIDVDELDEELIDDASKSKLDEIKESLSEKLPFLSGLLSKIGNAKNKSDEEEEEPASVTASSNLGIEKPKRKITLIQAVIGVGLIVAVALEFIPTDPAPTAQSGQPVANNQPTSEEKTPPPPPEETVVENNQPEPEVVAPDESNTQAPIVVDNSEVTEDPISDNIDTSEPNDSTEDIFADQDNENVPTKQPNTQDEVVDVNSEIEDDMNTDESDLNDGPSENVGVVTGAADTDINDLDAKTMAKNSETISDRNNDTNKDNQIDLTQNLDFGDKLSDTILKDLEVQMKSEKEKMKKNKVLMPTDPPDYENLGRGLVYNCSGLHWAVLIKLVTRPVSKIMLGITSNLKIKSVYLFRFIQIVKIVR